VSTSAVPVFLVTDFIFGNAERAKVRQFTQASLHLGEAGQAGEADHVVPEFDRLGIAG
jgi:hypothetical protein